MSAAPQSTDDYVKSILTFASSSAPASAGQNAQLVTAHLSQQYTETSTAPDELPWDKLWNAFASIAKDPHDDNDAVQDRAIELLAAIKALPVLEKAGTPCKTSLGTAWHDLPYFGVSMRDAWNFAPPSMSDEQWARLNAFVARVTAKGVSDFSLYAIWSIRDALEVPRVFSERDTSAGDAPPKNKEEAPISELLPGALQWFVHCGPQLWQLVQQKRGYKTASNQPDPAKLGKLASEAGLTETGFNKARWDFWKQRFQEVSEVK